MTIIVDDIKKDTIITRKIDRNNQDELILKLLQIVDPNVKKVTNGTMKVFLIEIGMYIPGKLKSEDLKNKLLKITEHIPEEGWNLEKLKEYVFENEELNKKKTERKEDNRIKEIMKLSSEYDGKTIITSQKKFLQSYNIHLHSIPSQKELDKYWNKLFENMPEEGWDENKLKEFVVKEKLDVRTRDHSKSQSAETLFKELLEKTDSFILNNKEYDIDHSTIKSGTNKTHTVKNDCMFEIKNESRELNGVQIKKLKNKNSKERIIVHNWKHKEQRKHVENHKDTTLEEKDIIDKDFENGCNEIFNHQKKWEKDYLDYRKSKSRPKQKNAKLLKFGMQVSDTPLSEYSKEIKSLQLKKNYIRNLYNPVHIFYHLKIYDNDLLNKNITLQELIDRMVLMDDKKIENFKLYWFPRPIYSTSGKTQLGQEDFLKSFSKTKSSSFIDEINNNNILM